MYAGGAENKRKTNRKKKSSMPQTEKENRAHASGKALERLKGICNSFP